MLKSLEFEKTSNQNTSNLNSSKSCTQRQSRQLVVQNKLKCVYRKRSHFISNLLYYCPIEITWPSSIFIVFRFWNKIKKERNYENRSIEHFF